MNKYVLVVFALLFSYSLMAQETVKQKEAGLFFSDFNNFGLSFRVGTNKSMWRFNTLFLSGGYRERTFENAIARSNDIGFGLSVGHEFRKVIANNFELRYGADVSYQHSYTQLTSEDTTIGDEVLEMESAEYRPGLNLVFGFNYVLNDKFVLGAALLPGVTYSIRDSSTRGAKDTRISYGLGNNSARLSIAYRF